MSLKTVNPKCQVDIQTMDTGSPTTVPPFFPVNRPLV